MDIPRNKRVEVALTYIFGIGPTTAKKIIAKTNVNPDTRVQNLTEEEVNRIRETVDKEHIVEGDLRRQVSMNIKRLIEIKCYRGIRHRMGLPARGIRHRMGLPARGQRTRTNARTRRGPRRTVGVRRKK